LEHAKRFNCLAGHRFYLVESILLFVFYFGCAFLTCYITGGGDNRLSIIGTPVKDKTVEANIGVINRYWQVIVLAVACSKPEFICTLNFELDELDIVIQIDWRRPQVTL
jgi:hypothetical protein